MSDKKIDHESRAHASISPSSGGQIYNCPPSIFLAKKLGLKGKDSGFASEGNYAHEVAEILLREKDGEDISDFDLEGENYNEDMRFYGAQYAKETIEAENRFTEGCEEKISLVEQRVVIDADRDCWGTSDRISYAQKGEDILVFIGDFKYGIGVPVDPEKSWQLRLYGYGAIKRLMAKDPTVKNRVKKLMLFICQPRVPEKSFPSFYEMDAKKLYEDMEKFFLQVDKALGWIESDVDVEDIEVAANMKAGDHCRFCPVKQHGRCHVYKEYISQGIIEKYAGLMDSIPKKNLKDKTKTRTIFTDEERAHIALHGTDIVNLINTVKSDVRQTLLSGGTNPFVKVKEGTMKTAWVSLPIKQLAEELEDLGIEDPYKPVKEPEIISISAALKHVTKKDLGDLIVTTEPNYKLVPGDGSAQMIDKVKDILKKRKKKID